tara:strand:+ start:763 stop:1863 length:1101 start_codon:yes stop_codon:yes gene_type:complete
MGFKCGIVGLPNVGKSTLFNALTESNKAEAANYPFATIEPNIGRVAVPDTRLYKLSELSKSQKTIPTFIDFVDIAGLVKGASKGEGLGNKFLSHIREVDAIAHVVRCFKDNDIAHVSSNIDPLNDIETITTEINLSDIESLQNKFNLLKKKSKQNDKKINSQLKIIEFCLDKLNNGEKIKIDDNINENFSFFQSLNLISHKPTMYICNVDENSINKGNEFSDKVKTYAEKEENNIVIVSASIESQIAEFKKEGEKKELLNDLGLKETTLKKVINSGYNILNLITFFTSGAKETRAWTITKNTTAPKAAGKIHSDFEKGFIRAETITYEDFIKYGGENASREVGKLRQEGKDYIINDGDVMHFLFNV